MRIVYAIGDIHGCYEQLLELLRLIEKHRDGRSYRLVFLGDYIDRGPNSAAVIAHLRKLQSIDQQNVVCLAGNHEDMLLQAHQDRAYFWRWIENGGGKVLESYGIRKVSQIPAGDIDWLSQLPTIYEDEHRYFVHAGLRPYHAVKMEDRETHLWIREDFLTVDFDFTKYVVHGHTAQMSGLPEVRQYRVNLDTACVYGHNLTAGVFSNTKGPAVEFISVH
ncbi:metallophosphoesterase family protein [Methylobacterium iners]|uniref:Bis(5'-nucleosyl)-tetraphosphatase PrpE [asymmetrical] n=2 Tax=Methylobacterium iners TaxID=418707 RepID=A0ABQ4S555_9HYPH|nr:Bis(5'-nucleosyl)-tetraphosphatase PrpE [asymmetrical] [Methylobacterium iners]